MKKILFSGIIGFLFFNLVVASTNKIIDSLQSFKLTDIKLLDGPFYKAQQADLKYILALDVDRLLAPFIKDAGLQPVKDNYGNWENIGLDGHIGGHYLSALSFMYASTGNPELLRRINYMLVWLDSCQQKNGNGYVGGVPNGQALWAEIESGKVNADGFSLSNRWVPLYNLHKLYAGLRDVYLITGNEKSLKILVKLCDWFYNLTKNLSDEQVQLILQTEHGGINEVFADVSAITSDNKYLELAVRVSHRAILNPLLNNENKLTGLHANTQIPKVIGYKRIADLKNYSEWSMAAEFFWKTVIDNWTVSIGGNSVREHFHPANDFSSMTESNQGPETCNTYNMLRLTKLLFLSNPDKKYIDYYERALFNHILSSEHPEKGGFVYFTPMRPQHYRVYSQPQECFWCCVGSGLENHAKYGEMIYSHNTNELYVNLFIASVLSWKEIGLTLTQETKFPSEESTELKIKIDKPQQFVLKIRKPSWAKAEGLVLLVNGKIQNNVISDSDYIAINKKWKTGDVVKLVFPMKTHVEYLPDGSNWASVLHGPIVLAAIVDSNSLDGLWADDSRMGHVANGQLYPMTECPVIASDDKDFSSAIVPVKGKPMTFTFANLIYPDDRKVELKPFFDIHEARYIIYFPVWDYAQIQKNNERLQEIENEKLLLEQRTVDQIAPGEQQPEAEHNFNGKDTQTGLNRDKHWRDASAWFGYELRNKNNEGKILRITYFGLDKGRVFDILVNDEKLATVELKGDNGDTFFDVDYSIPDNFLQKSTNDILNIKFVAAENSVAGGIYFIRLLK